MLHGKKIVIAGGSGFIGDAMAKHWGDTNEVVILTRGIKGAANNSYSNKEKSRSVRYVLWDGATVGAWAGELEGCEVLINLSGKSVNCRYTEANKSEIFSSRVNSTKVLGDAIKQCVDAPKLWINGASATIYPHASNEARDETFTAFSDDFSVQVCKVWEETFNAIELNNTRKVILRMAIVLGEGGVMVPFKRLVKLGLGGRQGNGKQMFSWIHIEDLRRIIEWLAERPEHSGVYNAAAPGPVTNAAFMASLRKRLRMPIGLPAPALLLKAGALLIGTETELLLKSRWVVPQRLIKEGFVFKYASIAEAVAHL